MKPEFVQGHGGSDSRKTHAVEIMPTVPARAVCGAEVLTESPRRFSVSSPSSCVNCARVVSGRLYSK